MDYNIRKLTDYLWELPKTGNMRVPARIYATEAMIAQIVRDKAPQQAVNVAQMPGIVTASLAMPDIHWGYGFPIGGVAAIDLVEGVISPGGVGYDINCGVRLMASRLDPRTGQAAACASLSNQLFRDIPTGVGAAGALTVSIDELRRVVGRGACWAVEHGYGTRGRPRAYRGRGLLDGADPAEVVSDRAWQRGREQSARLARAIISSRSRSSTEIYDTEAARVWACSTRRDHGHDPLRVARLRLPGLRRLPWRDRTAR